MEVTFPNEVWLHIFKRLDLQSLMKLRLVCHRFFELIEHLLNKSLEWKELTHETNLYLCLETMQRTYPYVLVTNGMDIDDPILWRGTYLSYKKWQQVLVNPHTKDTIVPHSKLGHISCICTFDKYIAIAFDSGLVANYTIDDISQPFYLADHGTSLIQVEFWYSNGDVLVVSVGEDCALKFWNIQNKIEIATNGFFANSIHSGECRHFCIGDMGGILTSYERVGEHISPGPTLDVQLRDDEQLIVHIIYGKYMAAMVWSNRDSTLLIPYDAVIEGGKLNQFIMSPEHDCILLREYLGDSLQVLILGTSVIVFVTALNRIGSRSSHSYKKMWYESNMSRKFGCDVISIALHAQILMLGLKDGSIHLLRIPEYFHGADVKKNIKYLRKIKVDSEPIVHLTVLEVDKKPCIVAVTEHKVHLINFF